MFNLYVEALQQLPSCLIFKHVDDDALFLSDALAQHLMIEKTKFDARTQCPIQFYDLHSGVGLSGDHCPIAIAQSGGELCQHIMLQVGARRFCCYLQSKFTNHQGAQWLVIQATLSQPYVNTPSSAVWEEKLSFSMMLSSISTRLINVNDNEVDTLIERTLGTFGEYLKAQRCYLFCFSPDKSVMNNTHEWVAGGVTPFKDDLQQVPMTQLPYFEKVIKQDHAFVVSDVRLLPDAAGLERAEFIREGIRAVLCVAVHLNEELFGFIGCDFLSGTHNWSDHEIKSMKLIGEMVTETLASVSTRRSLQQVQRELLQANKRLEVLVNLDGLTHIANRRHFDKSLAMLWKQSHQSKCGVSLLLVDVDYFKRYNDTYGHQAGDHVLQAIACVLEDVANAHGGLAARYGGEEFAVILPDRLISSALPIARQVMSAVNALDIAFASAPLPGHVTVSIGLADSNCASQPQLLINHADNALYQAKQSGRNKVICTKKTATTD